MRVLRLLGNTIRRRFVSVVLGACCLIIWKDSQEWLDDCSWKEPNPDGPGPDLDCVSYWSESEVWSSEEIWTTSRPWDESEVWDNDQTWDSGVCSSNTECSIWSESEIWSETNIWLISELWDNNKLWSSQEAWDSDGC